MKSQHVNRVDLSLDDIIKMDGLGQSQDQNRGGNNQNRGGNNQNRVGNNRGQNNQRNNGQGQRGFRTLGQQGGGQRFGGISPLNRDKGLSMNTLARRGQMMTGGGQRTNNGTWSGNRGGGGGGGMKWGGSANTGWTNNNMTHRANNRQFNSSRPDRTGQGGNQIYQRGLQSNHTQGSVQRWGRPNNLGGGRQGQSGMQAGNLTNHQQGGLGQGQGGGGLGQGDLRIKVDHISFQDQTQTRQGLKDMTFDQKRRKAMQALREARKTIAQLDQQSARQQVVNERRGIAPQPSVRLSGPGPSYQSTSDDRYASNLSLASDSSDSSSSSDSDLQDQPIMSFKMTTPGSGMSKQKRWQHKSPEEDRCDSTLTISIDNSAPFVSHSELTPTPKDHGHLSPHSSYGSLHHGTQHWSRQPKGRRKQYHHQQQQQQYNDRRAHSAPSSPPYPQHTHDSRHGSSQQHWHPQDGGAGRLTDTVDMRRGATPGFSRQLSHLKPSVAMKYMFQKKTFSAASTPVSLNDRFSEPDDLAGRKVFM